MCGDIGMRVLVCGGRKFDNSSLFFDTMMKYIGSSEPKHIVIIEGGAKGADRMAQSFADQNGCKRETFPAQWDKYGKSAGFIRNKQMLDEGKPDLVIAFPGGKGTTMMVDIAIKAGVQVVLVNE